jgi:hypothetical protein
MTYDEMRRMLSSDVTQNVWNVMYFYQRLSFAINHKNIHEKYVGEMFGENFIWWYQRSYDKQLVNIESKDEDIPWQAGRDIDSLRRWLYKIRTKSNTNNGRGESQPDARPNR